MSFGGRHQLLDLEVCLSWSPTQYTLMAKQQLSPLDGELWPLVRMALPSLCLRMKARTGGCVLAAANQMFATGRAEPFWQQPENLHSIGRLTDARALLFHVGLFPKYFRNLDSYRVASLPQSWLCQQDFV